MKSGELRKIPAKNYVVLGIILIATMFLLYYFQLWVNVYKESMVNVAILDQYMTVINYNELEDYVIENPNTLIYVSVLEDEVIRDFEKKLKNKYKKRKIVNDILYMDITDDVMDESIKKSMISRYSLNSLNITSVPCVLYFEDGLLKSIYSVSDNNYNIDSFVSYVNSIDLESVGM